jgi:hypothetical protein
MNDRRHFQLNYLTSIILLRLIHWLHIPEKLLCRLQVIGQYFGSEACTRAPALSVESTSVPILLVTRIGPLLAKDT